MSDQGKQMNSAAEVMEKAFDAFNLTAGDFDSKYYPRHRISDLMIDLRAAIERERERERVFERMREALAVMTDVFVASAEPGPQAHAENAAMDNAQSALAAAGRIEKGE